MTSLPAPTRFALAGGTRVVRRGRDHLQVGLVPGRCVVVPETPGHRATLAALRTADLPPAGEETASLLPRLAAHGLLRRAGPRPPAAVPVAVEGSLGVDPEPLLAAAALRVTGRGGSRRRRPVLVLALAEVDRDRLDALVRDETPHLLVRVVDGEPVLGPLVVPGETACVRCVDAHRVDDDPGHAAVLDRYLAAPAPPGGDPPLTPTLATLLTCWAAHELRSHVDGGRPVTWSTTLAWDAGFAALTATTWCRHACCGCGSAVDVDVSGRIEA